MFLGDYFNNIKSNYKKFFFSGISFNSNQVKKNNIFFAIKGNKVDGNKFIFECNKKWSKNYCLTEKKLKMRFKNNILFIKSKM